ncbi:MAG TPA: hypothetical protein VMG30_00225 [Acidobacteriota bacterium]|nr:hypothetical protein [Acidobacteriota bacterium]
MFHKRPAQPFRDGRSLYLKDEKFPWARAAHRKKIGSKVRGQRVSGGPGSLGFLSFYDEILFHKQK